MTDPVTPIDQKLQVIVQSFQFNDFGHITRFHLAGSCGGGEPGVPPDDYMGTVQDCINILQVWRPSGGDGFSIAANFTATLAVTYNTPVTTSVAVDEPIPFSSGDVLGFTPGPGFFFAIYTTPNQQPASHTYYTFSSFAAELSTTDNGVVASPIISVEGMCTTHMINYAFYSVMRVTVTAPFCSELQAGESRCLFSPCWSGGWVGGNCHCRGCAGGAHCSCCHHLASKEEALAQQPLAPQAKGRCVCVCMCECEYVFVVSLG